MIITTAHWNRPVYSRRMAESLAACRGIEKCHVIARIEPSEFSDEIIESLGKIPSHGITIIENRERFGCGENTYECLRSGFTQGSRPHRLDDFVIHVEDDVLLARDALEFFAWARDHYAGDQSVLNVTAWQNLQSRHHQEMHHEVVRDPWFSPWGWGTWRDRWLTISDQWESNPWDVNINERVRQGRVQICPTLSRAQNIGAEAGTYCPGPEWHAEHQHCRLWSEELPEQFGMWHEREGVPLGSRA